MEIKIEVGEERFRDVLENELAAFTKEELHEICRKALIQQMADPAVFQGLFVEKSNGWNSQAYHASDILKAAAKTVDFDETFKELQDGIIGYIKENHLKILHELAINMFIEGLSGCIAYSDKFRSRIREELCSRANNG